MIKGASLEVGLLSLRIPKLKGLGASRQIGTRTIDRNNDDDEDTMAMMMMWVGGAIICQGVSAQ